MLSVKVALKKFYGYDKITRSNFLEIGRKLNADNTVENYHKILHDANIKKMLVQTVEGSKTEKEFINLTTLGWQFNREKVWVQQCRTNTLLTLDEILSDYETELKKEKAMGSVGVKFFPHVFIEPLDSAGAIAELEAIKKGAEFNERSKLGRFIYEKQIDIATRLNMVVAIHTGVWANITDKTPMILFSIVEKHPNTTFDIYHMGIPHIREAAFLGKNYPNVYLNMCWAHAVSESMVLNSLDEWIDLVPTNKIIAFGGDVITLPQHAVGMLEVAKQNICLGLARRITRKRLDMPAAKKILLDWFYNNPKRIYNLPD
jgi:predicted TIM-barrel fold metal-dependent hydrolase